VSRVAVLSGGRSSEHEVSLASGAAVRDGLARAGHGVLDVLIERDGRWLHDGRPVTMTPGEDVPYVGAGVLASALCMDKVLFKELMARHDVPQVDYRRVTEGAYRADPGGVLAALEALGRPVFVKPARLGSSVGIVRVSEGGMELAGALDVAFEHDALAIVEAGAPGLEVECSVLGHRDPEASTPGEIVLASGDGWYDYEAKYTDGGMELVVPPRISDAARERVRELAVGAFALAGVSGLARVDFFVAGEDVLVNELNTMPGFTETSVYAKLWSESGLPFPDLVDRLVALGIERHADEQAYRH